MQPNQRFLITDIFLVKRYHFLWLLLSYLYSEVTLMFRAHHSSRAKSTIQFIKLRSCSRLLAYMYQLVAPIISGAMAGFEKGLKHIIDDEGKFVYTTKEYNGHLYTPFKGLVEKIDSYWESFPVYDTDIYLLCYPKSGMYSGY